MQKGENMFCFLGKFCFFFMVHTSERLDLKGSQRLTTVHNGSQRFTSPVKESIGYSLFV